MTEPKLANEPMESTDVSEPADSTDTSEPTEPMDRIEPAEPMDRIEPLEPIDRIEPLEPIDRVEPSFFAMAPILAGGMLARAGWRQWPADRPPDKLTVDDEAQRSRPGAPPGARGADGRRPFHPELVIAAAGAGALGFLAAGYKTPAAMAAEIAAVRAATTGPFGVNVFVPGAPSTNAATIAGYLGSLAPDAAAVGAPMGPATWDDDGFGEKIEVLRADPPALVSFTFGCPPAALITALSDVGCLVAVTVTDPGEAAIAVAAGADALCVQGVEAGAHRGAFANDSFANDSAANDSAANDSAANDSAANDSAANDSAASQGRGLIDLIGEIAQITRLPQIATGGIMGPGQVAAALAAGAVAVQCGTAFLRCPESGAPPRYKDALADPRYTTAYPEINNATRPLRAAAAGRGDTERMSLWAGQGYRSARALPAGEIIERLSAGTRLTPATVLGDGGTQWRNHASVRENSRFYPERRWFLRFPPVTPAGCQRMATPGACGPPARPRLCAAARIRSAVSAETRHPFPSRVA